MERDQEEGVATESPTERGWRRATFLKNGIPLFAYINTCASRYRASFHPPFRGRCLPPAFRHPPRLYCGLHPSQKRDQRHSALEKEDTPLLDSPILPFTSSHVLDGVFVLRSTSMVFVLLSLPVRMDGMHVALPPREWCTSGICWRGDAHCRRISLPLVSWREMVQSVRHPHLRLLCIRTELRASIFLMPMYSFMTKLCAAGPISVTFSTTKVHSFLLPVVQTETGGGRSALYKPHMRLSRRVLLPLVRF
mmetsp:Transcript_22651/g.63648  ORF Transcript_22651/g.63648 Transcript_22651/m.63648 type:complete len:250 (+) Transcript_22651:523-1272(+)